MEVEVEANDYLLQGFRTSLIDKDSPASVLIKDGLGPNGDETWSLQWSDEFEKDGRSFYPGHDPFWEAVSAFFLS